MLKNTFLLEILSCRDISFNTNVKPGKWLVTSVLLYGASIFHRLGVCLRAEERGRQTSQFRFSLRDPLRRRAMQRYQSRAIKITFLRSSPGDYSVRVFIP